MTFWFRNKNRKDGNQMAKIGKQMVNMDDSGKIDEEREGKD